VKDISLFAIDRNWAGAGKTVGMEATQVEKVGDFEIVDPASLGDKWFGVGYVKRRVVSVLFDTLDELAEKIESFPGFVKTEGFKDPIEPGGITLLVVVCHGRPGVLFIDGVDANGVNPSAFLTASRIANYAADLGKLRKYLAARDPSRGGSLQFATIRFDGCNAGADTTDPHEARGSDLLIALSKAWPGTRVVAFVDYGIGRENNSAPFRFQGAEDSNVYFDETQQEPKFGRWAAAFHGWRSENSPNAKIAQDGVIVSRPAHEIFGQSPGAVERQMRDGTLDRSTIELYGIGGATAQGAYALPAPTGASGRRGSFFRSPETSP
jgi:hypothetical protein